MGTNRRREKRRRIEQLQTKKNSIPVDVLPGYLLIRVLHKTLLGAIFLAQSTSCEDVIRLIKFTPSEYMHVTFSPLHEDPLQEVHVLKHIQSSNHSCSMVISLIESIETKYGLFLVFPYYKGGDMFDRIYCTRSVSLRHPEFTTNNVRRYFRQTCLAVSQLHQCGVAHLDIALENICVDSETDTIKLIDFGTARLLTDMKQITTSDHPTEQCVCPVCERKRCQSIVIKSSFPYWENSDQSNSTSLISPLCLRMCPGRIHYFTPEMLDGKAWNPLAKDVWSLAFLLMTMLMGKMPYQVCHTTYRPDRWMQFVCSGEWLKVTSYSKLDDTHWNKMQVFSVQEKDLLDKMLQPEYLRPTISEILEHPYLR